MLSVCRRLMLANVNRCANIAQSRVNAAATVTAIDATNITRYQPTFVRHSSYEGDGKTKVKVLNIDFEMGLMINSYSDSGFRLNTDFKVIGPMAIFPRMILAWNVDSTADITEQSLRLFCVLEPKLDILVIGTGDEEVTLDMIKRIKTITQKYKLIVEVLKTEAAVTTFNFLNAESRVVAAALIPPKKLKFNDMGLLAAQARHEELYGTDKLIEGGDQIILKD